MHSYIRSGQVKCIEDTSAPVVVHVLRALYDEPVADGQHTVVVAVTERDEGLVVDGLAVHVRRLVLAVGAVPPGGVSS